MDRGAKAGAGAGLASPFVLKSPHCFGFRNSEEDVRELGELPVMRKQSYSYPISLISEMS